MPYLVATVLSAVLPALQGPADPREPILLERPPSVLVIILDDVGHQESPNLHSLFGPGGLAELGVTMERCYAAPLCSPSRLQMLTGRYPRREGVGGNLDPLDSSIPGISSDLVTMPELLAGGRRTALVGKWHVARAPAECPVPDPVTFSPSCHGFDEWMAGNPSAPSLGPGASGYYDWLRIDDWEMAPSSQYATRAQTDALLAWWSEIHGPKLAWLGLSSAHDPFNTPPGFAPAGTTRLAYEQVVAYADMRIAEILAAVDLSDTYVVVLGDNGTPNSARPTGAPFNQWKFTTFEGGIRVPMVIAGPGIAQGARSDRLVSLVDLPATIAELVGLSSPATMIDSRSFANAIGGWAGTAPRQFVFSERYSASYDDQAVVEEQLKLRRVDVDGPAGAAAPQDLFYEVDLETGLDVPVVPSVDDQNRLRAELEGLPPRAP